MAKIQNFEEIKAWQKARDIVNKIYEITGKKEFSRDYALRDQIRKAAISIMSNISEGYSRGSDKEFVRFLFIAKASAAEVQSQLYVSIDQGYISENQFEDLYDLLEHCSRQISNFIKYLRGG